MKKLSLILLLILALTASSALADVTLVDPYADYPAEAAMSDYLAGQLENALGQKVQVKRFSDIAEAVNAFLALPDPDEALLLCCQDALILSLQGYIDQDLRVALRPLTQAAASGSDFYAAPAVLEALPEITPESLLAYTEENAYELFIARLIEASHNDYLVLEATTELYVDQNLYMDYGEAAEEAENGAPDIAVFSAAMLPKEAAGYKRLFSANLPGIGQGVFAQAGASDAFSLAVWQAVKAACEESAWQALLAQGGYNGAPCPEEAEFAKQVKDLFADYVRYLTSEGLFFYEQ
ncbi:MAG: hypothetical protein IJQ62_14425 [Clostridia bacterium]|nr:hypothetical protein [Clostridia bacterium]